MIKKYSLYDSIPYFPRVTRPIERCLQFPRVVEQNRQTTMSTIRKATPADVPIVVEYIEKKAEFDRSLGCFDGSLGTTSERIAKALFGAPVFAHALLATDREVTNGFAFYYYRFSSFEARPSLWLDDLYVDAEGRRKGAGLALMSALATEAILHDCTHIAWTANANNPSGIPFYTKIGAKLTSKNGSSLSYSINPESLAARVDEIQQSDKALVTEAGR